MSLAKSKILQMSPRAAGTVRFLPNTMSSPVYVRPGSRQQRRLYGNKSEMHRPKSRGGYNATPASSRPPTPHDHRHKWTPHKTRTIPDHLITTGKDREEHERQYVDNRTLKPPPSPFLTLKDRPQKDRIQAAIKKMRETYEHRSSGFYKIFADWDQGGRKGAKVKRASIDADALLKQCKVHGITWLDKEDCAKIIKEFKHDPDVEAGKLHFKDWCHLTVKHATEYSQWDEKYNPFEHEGRKGWTSPLRRKRERTEKLQETNPWRKRYDDDEPDLDKDITVSRPSTAASVASRTSTATNPDSVEPHLLHLMDEFREQIIEAKKKTVGTNPLRKEDFQKMFLVLRQRYHLPINSSDITQMRKFLDPNDDGEVTHHELISRLAHGYNKLQRLNASRPPSCATSNAGRISSLGESQHTLPGYLRPHRNRNLAQTKNPSPRTRRFFNKNEMFEQTRKYDGSSSPRYSRAANRPVSNQRWNGRERISDERPWNKPSNRGQTRPWTASHVARRQFLKSREAAKAETTRYDLSLRHGKMALSSLSPRRGGYMKRPTISRR